MSTAASWGRSVRPVALQKGALARSAYSWAREVSAGAPSNTGQSRSSRHSWSPTAAKCRTGHCRRASLAPSCRPTKPRDSAGAAASRANAASRVCSEGVRRAASPAAPTDAVPLGAPSMRNMSTRLNGALSLPAVVPLRKEAQTPLLRPKPSASRSKPRTEQSDPASRRVSRRAGSVVVRLMISCGWATSRTRRVQASRSPAAPRQSRSSAASHCAPGRGQARSTWRNRLSASAKLSRQTSCTLRPRRCRSVMSA